MQLEDKIIAKLIEMDGKLDMCASKEDLKAVEDRIVTVLDSHTSMLEGLDLERMAMITRIERIETDVSGLKSVSS